MLLNVLLCIEQIPLAAFGSNTVLEPGSASRKLIYMCQLLSLSLLSQLHTIDESAQDSSIYLTMEAGSVTQMCF
jgi:hypothetical protein